MEKRRGLLAARNLGLKRRVYTREFKLEVLREVEKGKNIEQVAREYKLTSNAIRKWRRVLLKYQDKAFAGNGRTYTDEARVAQLERMVGRLAMENDLLKKLLRELREPR